MSKINDLFYWAHVISKKWRINICTHQHFCPVDDGENVEHDTAWILKTAFFVVGYLTLWRSRHNWTMQKMLLLSLLFLTTIPQVWLKLINEICCRGVSWKESMIEFKCVCYSVIANVFCAQYHFYHFEIFMMFTLQYKTIWEVPVWLMDPEIKYCTNSSTTRELAESSLEIWNKDGQVK